MRKIIILGLALILSLGANLFGQASSDDVTPLRIYSSVAYMQPVKNMSKYAYGFGVYSHVDYNFNKHFAARLDIGWNDVSGPEKQFVDQSGTVHVEHPNMSIWEFTAGLRALIGPVYFEGRGGYFTGVDSWGYVPAVGIVFWKLDIQANYYFVGEKEWAGIRIGYYF